MISIGAARLIHRARARTLEISRNYRIILYSRGLAPCRPFHASSASRLRQSPTPKVRNYYANGGGGSRSGIRAFLDRINGTYLVYGIIALDVAVWAGFQVANSALACTDLLILGMILTRLQQMRDPKPLRWLYDNMTSSLENLKRGRV